MMNGMLWSAPELKERQCCCPASGNGGAARLHAVIRKVLALGGDEAVRVNADPQTVTMLLRRLPLLLKAVRMI
jgi:hypothetical protein